MTYAPLYRRWRPQTFAEIVGQDHVVATLTNALATGQVHHALLFCGTRGTGKTSTARILAKALNCIRGPTPEPCNVCESCVAITAGTSLDVIEIDAASHGSVDDARELRERASYAPATSRYKVYIVDEAHMVTTQGFNAMLKVLEEPPPHVRFVFATTEPHKVIEAIRSRCQRHDFRRVPTRLLAEHLTRMCAAEGVSVEPAAIELLARAGDGSHRDAQSRLDQVLTYKGADVTLADVALMLGALPSELRFDLGDALAAHRPADTLVLVGRVVDGGNDLVQFAREALEHVRDLFVTQLAPDDDTLVDVTPETRERLSAQANRFGPGELARLVRMLGELASDLRTATDQRLVLEVGLARAALPEASLDAGALLARIERLERRLGVEGVTGPPAAMGPDGDGERAHPTAASGATQEALPAAPAASAAKQPVRGPKQPGGGKATPDGAPAAVADASGASTSAVEAAVNFELVHRSWPLVLEHVARASRVTATLLEPGQPVALEGRQVLLSYAAQSRFHGEGLQRDDRSELVDSVLQELLGGELRIRVVFADAEVPGSEAGAPPADGPPDSPASPTSPAAAADADPEPDVNPDEDPGEPLGTDADARAVADLVGRTLGGEVIDQRPRKRGER